MIIIVPLSILLWVFTVTAAARTSGSCVDGWRSLQCSYNMPTSNFFNLHSMPRCGGGNDDNNNNTHRDDIIASLERRVKELEIEIERLGSNANNNSNERRIPTQQTTTRFNKPSSPFAIQEEEKKKVPLPKQIVNVARNIFSIGSRFRRNTDRKSSQQKKKLAGSTDLMKEDDYEDAYIDHSFDDLDRILENTTVALDIPTNNNINIDEEEGYRNNNIQSNTKSWKNYKRREGSTIQVWMKNKFISKETINAISTIKSIILKFPDYGVVDVFIYR